MRSRSHNSTLWRSRLPQYDAAVLHLHRSLQPSSALRAYGGSFWAPVLVGIYALGLVVDYQHLVTAYSGLGYEVTVLPKAGVAERAEFILRRLEGSCNGLSDDQGR